MSTTPEITAMLTRLAELAIRNSAGAIYTRIQSVRARKTDEATVNELVEIINELVDEKSQLIAIARALEDQLVAQRISDTELAFITSNLVPTIEKLMDMVDEPERPGVEVVEALKSLLATETFEILQLVGFNFKAAIGQPLTDIVERLIVRLVPSTADAPQLQLINAQRELTYAQIIQDPDAYARWVQQTSHTA